MEVIKGILALTVFLIKLTALHAQESVTTSLTTVAPPAAVTPNKTKEKCYKYVGCFNNLPPYDNANLDIPKSPDFIKTTFQLFTRVDIGTNESVFLDYTDIETLKNSSFDPELAVKFVIHGFFNDIKSPWTYKIKDELLKKGDFNVINVAWGPGAAFPDYFQAVANTRVVAKQVELLIDMMVKLGSKYADFHLIGHSLGAHVSGQTGQNLRAKNLTLGRITGMDPAEPDYQDHPKSIRLDKDDAAFVDVIHTNGAPIGSGGAGMFEPCGDVDFYVNGGKEQPDCPNQFSGFFNHLGDLISGHTDKVGEMVSCSHSRSHDVFAESINSDCPFTSYPCSGYVKFQNGDCLTCGEKGCGTMGYNSDWYSARGMMFLNTRWKSPFCGHHYAVKLQVSSKSKNTKGTLKLQLNGTWGISEWLTITSKKDVDIPHGQKINSVVVSSGIIGHVQTFNIKYLKKTGGWLFSSKGQDQIKLNQMSVQSGESGHKYLLCIDSQLSTGRTYTYTATKGAHCA